MVRDDGIRKIDVGSKEQANPSAGIEPVRRKTESHE